MEIAIMGLSVPRPSEILQKNFSLFWGLQDEERSEMDVGGCVLSLHEFENQFYWYMLSYTLPPLNEHQSFV